MAPLTRPAHMHPLPRLGRLGRGRRGVLLAAAFIGLVVVVDALVHISAVLIGFLALAPLLAAAVDGPRRTAIVAGLTSTVAVVAGLSSGLFGSLDHLLRVAVVVLVSVAAVYVARSREERENRLRQMTEIAAATQGALLRDMPRHIGDVRLATRYRSAAVAARVGGDLYEAVESAYGVRLIIGDVCGKGLAVVRLASIVMGAFRQSALVRSDLSSVVRDLDRLVRAAAQGRDNVDFVTAVLVELCDDEIRVANCGHPAPLFRDAAGRVRSINTPRVCPPLGPGGEIAPVVTRHGWSLGSRLLLFTDGVLEARDDAMRFLPPQVLREALQAPSPTACLDGIMAAVLRHVGGHPTDDLALVLVERAGTARPWSLRDGRGHSDTSGSDWPETPPDHRTDRLATS
jgi:phosphoserine phosphatase RsbU/P